MGIGDTMKMHRSIAAIAAFFVITIGVLAAIAVAVVLSVGLTSSDSGTPAPASERTVIASSASAGSEPNGGSPGHHTVTGRSWMSSGATSADRSAAGQDPARRGDARRRRHVLHDDDRVAGEEFADIGRDKTGTGVRAAACRLPVACLTLIAASFAEGSDRAALMVSKYRDALLRIADGLCESDELEGDQIKAIVAEYTDVTERRGPVRIMPNVVA